MYGERRVSERKGVTKEESSGLFWGLSDARFGDSQDHFTIQISAIVLRCVYNMHVYTHEERRTDTAGQRERENVSDKEKDRDRKKDSEKERMEGD